MSKRGKRKKAVITDKGRKRVQDHLFLAELVLARPITPNGYPILIELGFDEEVYRLIATWEIAHIVRALCEIDSYKDALKLFRTNKDTLWPEISKIIEAVPNYIAFLRRMDARGGPCLEETA